MKAKTMNVLYLMSFCTLLTISVNAQSNITILINSQRVSAQTQNRQIASINQPLGNELLNAIRNPVIRDAQYYHEINEILDGKYGTYYADLVRQELLDTKSGKIKPKKENLTRTAVVDVNELTVTFLKNIARLNVESSNDLVKLTDKLKTMNINYIMIEGHKASNDINNYILTTNRVNTCKDYLIFKGIDKDIIKTKILLNNSDSSNSENVKIYVK